MEEKVKKLEERCENMEIELQEFYNNQIDTEFVYKKLVDLGDRSRRSNLRTDGVAEKRGETWRQCEDEVNDVFKEKLDLENINIERAHPSKRKTSDSKPRIIVCKPLSYKQKKEVLKNVKKLKGSDIFVNENFCLEKIQRRKEFWEEVKRLRSEGLSDPHFAFSNYWSIVVKVRRYNGD